MEVKLRPYLFEFLEIISKFYYLVVFVASHNRISKFLMKKIDPAGVYFKDILMQENCVKIKTGVSIIESAIHQGHPNRIEPEHEENFGGGQLNIELYELRDEWSTSVAFQR